MRDSVNNYDDIRCFWDHRVYFSKKKKKKKKNEQTAASQLTIYSIFSLAKRYLMEHINVSRHEIAVHRVYH